MNQSKKDIFKEIIRFLIVGGIATLCDYAIFYLFNLLLLPKINPEVLGKDAGLNIFISTALGFTTGLLVNWFLQKFVYRYITEKQTKSKIVFLKFVILSLVGFGLTELGMLLASPLFGKVTWHIIVDFDFWKLFFKVLMTIIVLIMNYIGRKIFVFNVKPEEQKENETNE
ncbi:MAG: GtrA family protein [Acholeplasmatales bacterium]|nr:GtrA family protein [Acholeplasmatales bacterium]